MPAVGLGFGSPALLGAAFAAGAAAITALHLLRRRRRRIEVGFAALWLRAVGERERRAARLRPLLSWLLHVIMLGLLVTAAGDPRTAGRARARRLAVILDASGSMAARDTMGGPTRLARARQEAERLLAGLGEGDEALVIAAGAQPHARGNLTSDTPSLRAQLQVEQEAGSIDLERALHLATSALAGAGGGAPRAQIVLVSDGANLQPALDGAGGMARAADLRWLPVGGASDNLAITSFAARRQPSHPADYDVLIEARAIRVASDRPVRARLEVRQEGVLVETLPLELPARGVVQRRLADLAGQGARLEARLVPEPEPAGHAPGGSVVDALDLDSVAHAVLPPRRPLRLLHVTPYDDLFLEGALLVDEVVKVERSEPARWDAGASAGYDALVLEGFVPPSLPAIPSLLVDPAGARIQAITGGEVAAPALAAQARRHPVMRFVDLSDVNFTRASLLRVAPGDAPLFSTVEGVLALARERPRRQVILGFDPRRTDLPMRPAFPLLIANALRWLAGDDSSSLAPVRVGEPATVEITAPEVMVIEPDGSRARRVAVDGHVRVVARQPGFHRVEGAGTTPLLLAANADPGESVIASPEALLLDGRPLPPPDPVSPGGAPAPWWRWLSLAALALLAVEWWGFHRRVTT